MTPHVMPRRKQRQTSGKHASVLRAGSMRNFFFDKRLLFCCGRSCWPPPAACSGLRQTPTLITTALTAVPSTSPPPPMFRSTNVRSVGEWTWYKVVRGFSQQGWVVET